MENTNTNPDSNPNTDPNPDPNPDPNTNLNNICLGIDFGTTNSCISVWANNKSWIVPDIDGLNIIPTVIEINDEHS